MNRLSAKKLIWPTPTMGAIKSEKPGGRTVNGIHRYWYPSPAAIERAVEM